MTTTTFNIRVSAENATTYFEVWRRTCDSYGECWESLLAEATTRPEAVELMRHYESLESQRRHQTRT
jgi:hypothetical protein